MSKVLLNVTLKKKYDFMLNRHRQNCCSYNLVVCIQGLDEEKSGKGRSIGKRDCHVETIIR